MPTTPVNTLVVRTLQPDVKRLLSTWSSYLNEIVNFGSHILKWIGDKDTLGGDEEMPLILTFRNTLELLDSISILFSQQSIDPCKLHLRALLESLFVIRYITDGDSKTRALNYLVCHYHNKIDTYRKLDPNTPQGLQWRKEIKSDILAGEMKMPEIDDLQGKIDNLERLLKKPAYAKSEAEYQRLRKLRKIKPVWYEFFGGPKKIVELARHLKLMGLYNILYRYFSKSIHGQDIIDQRVSATTTGKMQISQIRNPRNAQFLCTITVSLTLNIYRTLVKYYLPEREKEFAEWYVREIRHFLNKISKEKLLEVN